MPEDKSKFVDAMTKLIKLTQENKIKWQSESIKTVASQYPQYKIENVFTTTYKDKYLRLYRYCYEKPRDTIYDVFGGQKKEWLMGTSLEVIDNYGAKLWEFPKINALADLFKSIQYQTAEVKDIIDDLLKE